VSSATYVVVLRALGLGDLLTGVPAVRGVRRRWPSAEVALAAPEPVGRFLQELGVVDTVLPVSSLDEPIPSDGRPAPDVAVNLHGRGPQSHRLLRALAPRRLVGFACSDADFTDGPVWNEDEHEVDRWCRLVSRAGGPCGRDDLRLDLPGLSRVSEGLVLVHPGAAAPSRRWPVERWEAVVRALTDGGHRVVVTGVPAERDVCARVAASAPGVEDWCGRLGLRALAERVVSARLVLCGDTGVGHLATALGTPSVLLFGPTDPAHWGPALDPGSHPVIWHPRDGDPAGDPHGAEVDVRLARTGVDEVLHVVERVLDRRAPAAEQAR
jgi:ADP-heptose:LPS heptosyltransferase